MKIVIADCYHDSDKGGGGILGGAINTIYDVCKKHNCKIEISLIYRFSEEDPRFSSAYRLTSKTFPNVKILSAPISSRYGPGLLWIPFLFKAFFWGPLRLVFPNFRCNDAIRAIREADFIIFKGGNFYSSWSRKVLLDLIALYLITYTLLLARRLKSNFYVISHTFGPFYTNLSKRIIRFALEKAQYISCRESNSRDILIQTGLDPQKVFVSPDLGFAVFKTKKTLIEEILKKYKLLNDEFVAVTARSWFHESRKRGIEEDYQSYLMGMSSLCDYIYSKYGKKIALIVQNDEAHTNHESDYFPMLEIKNNMQHGEAAFIMNDDFYFHELVSIYSKALLTIGTRLHSCIFSFSVGTPSIAISYSHKAIGIMRMLESEKYILSIDNLSVEDGKKMIDEILHARSELSLKYSRKVKEFKRQLSVIIDQILFGSVFGQKNYDKEYKKNRN